MLKRIVALSLTMIFAANVAYADKGDAAPGPNLGDYSSVGGPEAGIPVPVDLTGVVFNGGEGEAGNVILSVDIGAAVGTPGSATMNGVGWDFVLEAFSPSWLSEATIGFSGDGGASNPIFLTASGTGAPGVEAVSSGGIVKLADAGIPDLPLAGGILTMEFFDTFDDGIRPQAEVLSGGLVIQAAVPEPTSIALLGISGLALLALRRR